MAFIARYLYFPENKKKQLLIPLCKGTKCIYWSLWIDVYYLLCQNCHILNRLSGINKCYYYPYKDKLITAEETAYSKRNFINSSLD